jgi:hypothetical protein
MRILSFTAASGTAAIALSAIFASSDALGDDPHVRALRAPSRPVHKAVSGTRKRPSATPSCSTNTAQEGTDQAFDSTWTFETFNKGGSTTFGNNTLAAAQFSGTFEGNGNTICDDESAIAAGSQNVLDSGSGNAPKGATHSFIGAGQFNVLSDSNSFLGAGNSNALAGSDSFIGAGGHNTVVTGTAAFVGAGDGNTVAVSEAFLGAGLDNNASGVDSFIGAGQNNSTQAFSTFLGAGSQNVVSGILGFVGAGDQNSASGPAAFVGAGLDNQVSGTASFIGAGGSIDRQTSNSVAGADSFIGAGDGNNVAANEAFVGGGASNAIGSPGTYSAIGGGYHNEISGEFATIAGGQYNAATGTYGVVPGGRSDEASGTLSFAAGYQAEARHDGSFVWSDFVPGASPVADAANGQFVVRASGGTTIYSTEATSGTRANGVKLTSGSGTWASLSDRNAKTRVVALDDAEILTKVAALPVSTWTYRSEPGVRHVGPMAQDFYAAFGVGEDDRHITSIDEDGVALSAIKALKRENVAARADARKKQAEILALDAKVRRLEAAVATLLQRR